MNITVPAGASSDPVPQGTHAEGVVLIDPVTGQAYKASSGTGGVTRAFITLSYKAIAAATGYAIGDFIQQVEEYNTSTTPSTYIDTVWRNMTQETTLAGAPVATNIVPISATASSVSITSPPTFVTGQAKIAASGTAVNLAANALTRSISISSLPSNSALKQTVGGVGVTNTTDGTGNGAILSPGGSMSIDLTGNSNQIWVNGQTGDIFTFTGN